MYRAAVLTVSDKCSKGQREDELRDNHCPRSVEQMQTSERPAAPQQQRHDETDNHGRERHPRVDEADNHAPSAEAAPGKR